jgi:branched-chain amino acid transport system substrate-binding protein
MSVPGKMGWTVAGVAVALLAAVGLALVLPPSHARPAGAPGSAAAPPRSAPAAPACGAHLGLLGALSGSATGLTGPVRNGVRLAVDRFTQRHPGCPVSLVELDTAGDPAKAAAAAGQAAADPHLLGVIGPLLPEEAASALPVLDRAGLPAITPTVTAGALSAHGWKVFHRAVAGDTAQALAAARYLTGTMAARKVYVVDDGSAYGTELADTVRRALGAAVVGSDRVRGRDVAGTVARLKATAADAIYYGGSYPGAGPLLAQLRRAGVSGTLVGGDRIDDPNLFTLTDGQYVDGTVATCASCAVIDDADFLTGYGTAFNAEPTGYAATAYDVTTIFLLGLAHGAGDRAAMLAFVNGYDGSGVAGRYRFTPAGEPDPAVMTVGIRQVRAGQFQWVGSVPGA